MTMGKRMLSQKNKYWEEETPEVFEYGKNVLKVFRKAGKIQIFPKVSTAPNGVGRGSTLDLEGMKPSELPTLLSTLTEVISTYKPQSKAKD